MVEMELYRIRLDENRGGQLLVLREKGGTRLLHIVVGIFEADSIRMKVAGFEPPRPMTHDLLKSAIEALGGRLERVLIDRLSGGTFYGKLVLRDKDGKEVLVDTRPSDGIALAVRVGVPLFVADEVLEEAGVNP